MSVKPEVAPCRQSQNLLLMCAGKSTAALAKCWRRSAAFRR
jgi:hypothetical protein